MGNDDRVICARTDLRIESIFNKNIIYSGVCVMNIGKKGTLSQIWVKELPYIRDTKLRNKRLNTSGRIICYPWSAGRAVQSWVQPAVEISPEY